ncbi:MAG: (2Fe-2S)-binding protein [Paracoccus sp. (in: a-proteobacteria)]|uniref:(2Fe-2S)-binding protein n=1 Tax=Paracoccus sp. TaxID=267 RepID=UPI004058BE3A
MTARIQRIAEADRPPVTFRLDDAPASALQGDTVLTAVLANSGHLRASEFGAEARAGFCLMGVCQDCWMWQDCGPRLRACSTTVAEDMRLLTEPPRGWP